MCSHHFIHCIRWTSANSNIKEMCFDSLFVHDGIILCASINICKIGETYQTMADTEKLKNMRVLGAYLSNGVSIERMQEQEAWNASL